MGKIPDEPLIPGAVETPTGSIVTSSLSDNQPGVAIIDSDNRHPGASQSGTTKGRGRAMAAMGISQAVDNSEGGLINTFFPLIAAAFGVGEAMLGILSSISKFARMIFGPFWAMLADKYAARRSWCWSRVSGASGPSPAASPRV